MIPFQHCPYGQFGQQPADQLPWLLPRLISGQLHLPEAAAIVEEATV